MQQIVFLDSDTLDAGITLHHPDFPHHWQSYPRTAPEQVVERLKDARIAIINKVRIGAAELAQLPELKLIALAATGSDNVDLEACRAANVGVCNIRNYSGPSVPEHAMALMLACRATSSAGASRCWRGAGSKAASSASSTTTSWICTASSSASSAKGRSVRRSASGPKGWG